MSHDAAITMIRTVIQAGVKLGMIQHTLIIVMNKKYSLGRIVLF